METWPQATECREASHLGTANCQARTAQRLHRVGLNVGVDPGKVAYVSVQNLRHRPRCAPSPSFLFTFGLSGLIAARWRAAV